MHDDRTHVDLFSGIGGFSLAAAWAGFRTIAFAEVCPDASRILEYWWPGVPNLGDVRKLCRRAYDCERRDDGEVWCARCDADFGDCACVGTDQFTDTFGAVDLLTAGVPCQPASLLGERRGTADERWLWPDTLRIVRELRPRYCIFENPPALLTLEGGRAFNGIVGELAALGYVGFYDVLPAAAVGAGHLRERVFLVVTDVHSERWQGKRLLRPSQRQAHPQAGGSGETEAAPDRDRARLERHAGHGTPERGSLPTRPAPAPLVRGLERDDWLQTESPVVPLVYGLPNRVAEPALRCVGNTVVPQAVLPFLDAIRRKLLN